MFRYMMFSLSCLGVQLVLDYKLCLSKIIAILGEFFASNDFLVVCLFSRVDWGSHVSVPGHRRSVFVTDWCRYARIYRTSYKNTMWICYSKIYIIPSYITVNWVMLTKLCEILMTQNYRLQNQLTISWTLKFISHTVGTQWFSQYALINIKFVLIWRSKILKKELELCGIFGKFIIIDHHT